MGPTPTAAMGSTGDQPDAPAETPRGRGAVCSTDAPQAGARLPESPAGCDLDHPEMPGADTSTPTVNSST